MKQFWDERFFKQQIALLWATLSGLLLFAQWSNIAIFQMGDADDHLRLVQVRDWLAGQSWFDVTQYRINPPDGGPMHWSRLVDVPLAAVILLLEPLVGPMRAEQWAAAIIPLLTFGCVLALTAAIARRLFGHKAALLAAAAIFAIVPAINQLLPMRIDHHGWQLVLFLTCFHALIGKHSPLWSASILGLAAALWLEISVEALPFVILFLGLLAVRWIWPGQDEDRAGREIQFPVALLATAIGSAALFVMTEGLQPVANFCDALSPFHIAAWATLALVINAAICAGRTIGRPLRLVAKLAVSAFAAVAAAYCVLTMAPQCAGDAFASLDPVVREYWFDRTPEGLPLWALDARQWIAPLAGFAVGVAGLVFLFRSGTAIIAMDRMLIALLFIGTVIVGLYVSRVAVYALVIATILIAPAVLALFRKSDRLSGLLPRMGLRILAVCLLVPTLVGPLVYQLLATPAAAASGAAQAAEKTRFEKAFACHELPAIVALDRLAPARVMTGLDVSPSILQHSGLAIVATGHHRNQAAMKDVIETFTGTGETARTIMQRRDIDYLIGCDGSPELRYYGLRAPDGFWMQLQNGRTFDWLEPQPMIGPYQVWRVRPGGGS